jgi:multidrug efflux pump subunit AcrB
LWFGGALSTRQRLLKVKNVTKANLYGTQDEKIYVEFSHAKLATLGITTDQLFQSLARQNAVVPAGVLEITAQRVPLRVTGALDGAKAVAETRTRSRSLRGPILAGLASSCAHDDDRLRLPPVSPAQNSETGKKDSTGYRLRHLAEADRPIARL